LVERLVQFQKFIKAGILKRGSCSNKNWDFLTKIRKIGIFGGAFKTISEIVN